MPCGSMADFTRRVIAASAGASLGTTSTLARRLSGARISVQTPPAAGAARVVCVAVRLGRGTSDPDQAAAPVEEAARARCWRRRQSRGATGGADRDPPQRLLVRVPQHCGVPDRVPCLAARFRVQDDRLTEACEILLEA